jgi:ankyrin repeat protein
MEVVSYLIQHCHADINKADKEGRTPLFAAAQGGHMETVTYLIQHCHADINQADQKGRTPLFAAAQGGHMGVVQSLAKDLEPTSTRRVTTEQRLY